LHGDDVRVVVLLEERQQIVSSMSDLLPRPTIAETPIFAEREKADDRHADAARLRRQRA
jgi:hypothetical protein